MKGWILERILSGAASLSRDPHVRIALLQGRVRMWTRLEARAVERRGEAKGNKRRRNRWDRAVTNRRAKVAELKGRLEGLQAEVLS